MPFLNPSNFSKYKTTILGSLVILLFIALCFLIYREVSNSRQIKNEEMQARIDTIIQYKTLAGRTAYKVYEKQVVDKKTTDSLARELKIKDKEIERYITLIAKADYSPIRGSARDTVYIDQYNISHVGKYGEYRDGYIDVAALITDSLKFIKLQTIDTLTGVFQKTKIGNSIFNKLIVTNKSPYNKIVGLEDISIKEAPQYRRLSLGLSAGWDPFNKRPYAGIGLTWAIWRFKK